MSNQHNLPNMSGNFQTFRNGEGVPTSLAGGTKNLFAVISGAVQSAVYTWLILVNSCTLVFVLCRGFQSEELRYCIVGTRCTSTTICERQTAVSVLHGRSVQLYCKTELTDLRE